MATVRWIVFREAETCSVARVAPGEIDTQRLDLASTMPVEEIADAIQQHLQARGYAGDGILIGLASETCQAAPIRLDEQLSSRDQGALTYALEEQLPLSAEDVVADFVTVDSQSPSALGVAVETAEVAPLVQAFEDRGIVVQSLAPTAMLALQEHVAFNGSDPSQLVAWKNDRHLELFSVQNDRPTDWRVLSADAPSLRRELAATALTRVGPVRVVALDVDPDLLEAVFSSSEFQLDEQTANSLEHAAATQAYRVLVGQSRPWIELRRGDLAPSDAHRAIRGELRWATVAMVVFLVALASSLLVRSYRYQRVAANYQHQQRLLFEQLLPGQPVPLGIRSRLESEHAKLAGMAGQASDLPEMSSALETLHTFLKCLPDEPRFRILEVRLDPGGQLVVEGRVRSHGDAARLATAIQAGGFRVEPPRSEQLADQTVSVTVVASQAEDPT